MDLPNKFLTLLMNFTKEKKSNSKCKISDKLLTLINDKFGNYCIQKMIEYSPKNIQILIIKKIASLDLKSGEGYCNIYFNSAKHIADFIEKKGYPKPGSFEFQKLSK